MSAQGSQQATQDHQGGHVHLCMGPPTKQKSRKVPASAHLGPSTTGIAYTTVPTSQPATQHHNHLTPLLVPPPHSPITSTPLPLTPKWGVHQFFFPMVSTHVYPKYPLSLSTTSPTPAPSW